MPLKVLRLNLAGADVFSFLWLVAFKGGFGAILGAAMIPLVVLPSISR